jgi:hypothetical protein
LKGIADTGFLLAFLDRNDSHHSWAVSVAQRRRPALADLCLIRMSELYPKHVVLTIDEGDFRVYRRNKREVIPILSPRGR